jgi:hypothetical protein
VRRLVAEMTLERGPRWGRRWWIEVVAGARGGASAMGWSMAASSSSFEGVVVWVLWVPGGRREREGDCSSVVDGGASWVTEPPSVVWSGML